MYCECVRRIDVSVKMQKKSVGGGSWGSGGGGGAWGSGILKKNRGWWVERIRLGGSGWM